MHFSNLMFTTFDKTLPEKAEKSLDLFNSKQIRKDLNK